MSSVGTISQSNAANLSKKLNMPKRAMKKSVTPSLANEILENAKGPKKVAGDAGSVEQHSLQDQIAAERFLAAKEATRRRGLGIKLVKLSPDGTV